MTRKLKLDRENYEIIILFDGIEISRALIKYLSNEEIKKKYKEIYSEYQQLMDCNF